MRIGTLGTGAVGTTIAAKLREVGHDIRAASRAVEMYLPLWLALFGRFGTPNVSIAVVHA